MKKYIPNSITLVNLFCGCCAIVFIFLDYFLVGCLFILIGAIADFMDGMVARLLKVSSPLGKELDSLADMVSFGVVPGLILFKLLLLTNQQTVEIYAINNIIWALPAFLIPIFSGLRLAKFNLDERQTEDFIGLNTPANTIFIVGLLLTVHLNSFGWREYILNPYFLYPVIVILSYLLISELRIFGFKFKGLQWKGNEIRFIFLGIAILQLFLLKESALSTVIITYIVLAIIHNQMFTSRFKKNT